MSMFICNKCEKQFDSDFTEMHEVREGVYCDNCYQIKPSIIVQLTNLASQVPEKDYYFFSHIVNGNSDTPSVSLADYRECDCLEYTEQTTKVILKHIINSLCCEDLSFDTALEIVLEYINSIAKEEVMTEIKYEFWDYEEEKQ